MKLVCGRTITWVLLFQMACYLFPILLSSNPCLVVGGDCDEFLLHFKEMPQKLHYFQVSIYPEQERLKINELSFQFMKLE